MKLAPKDSNIETKYETPGTQKDINQGLNFGIETKYGTSSTPKGINQEFNFRNTPLQIEKVVFQTPGEKIVPPNVN